MIDTHGYQVKSSQVKSLTDLRATERAGECDVTDESSDENRDD